MNKHNSVTSTYYLLLKNKKREFVTELEKKGKNFNQYFSVNNEKQELINLLQDFVSSTKRKPKKQAIEDKPAEEKHAIQESLIEKHMKEQHEKNKRANDIEIVPNRARNESEKRTKKPKDEIKTELQTIDKSNFTTIQNSNKYSKPQYASLDDSQPQNSRNNNTF
jgi:hypothetical protein